MNKYLITGFVIALSAAPTMASSSTESLTNSTDPDLHTTGPKSPSSSPKAQPKLDAQKEFKGLFEEKLANIEYYYNTFEEKPTLDNFRQLNAHAIATGWLLESPASAFLRSQGYQEKFNKWKLKLNGPYMLTLLLNGIEQAHKDYKQAPSEAALNRLKEHVIEMEARAKKVPFQEMKNDVIKWRKEIYGQSLSPNFFSRLKASYEKYKDDTTQENVDAVIRAYRALEAQIADVNDPAVKAQAQEWKTKLVRKGFLVIKKPQSPYTKVYMSGLPENIVKTFDRN